MKPRICLGFDGSTSDDWTVIRAETLEGHQFTPTYAADIATIWNPDEYGGRIPRDQVHTAVSSLFERYDVARMYCDPRDWQSEIEAWALAHGEKVVMEWTTGRPQQMHLALERFVTDLAEGSLTHDACKVTAEHMDNCRKVPRPGERYVLSKPAGAYHQKIDAAVASVLAHQAACDARASGWGTEPTSYAYVF